MAKVLIFGGHGKVALLLEPLLAAAGDEVTAVIRNPSHEGDIAATGATPVVLDVEQSSHEQLAELIAGHDAVVWSAGAGGGDAARTKAVDQDAAMRAMEAAHRAGVARFVMVSYFGAGPDHGVDPENAFYAYAEAKAAADEHLRASSLDYTVLAPSALTDDEPTGRIDAATQTGSQVSRANAAAVIAATLADPSTIGRTIGFNDGETPIADAIRG